jgi:hypothetical protein
MTVADVYNMMQWTVVSTRGFAGAVLLPFYVLQEPLQHLT